MWTRSRCVRSAIVLAAFALAGATPRVGQALDLEQEWASPTTWAWLRAPAVKDTTLYLMTELGKLAAISLRTGRVIGQVSPPERGPYPTPAIATDTLYVCSANSNVSSYRLPEMTLRWSTYFERPDSFHGNMHPMWDLGPPAVSATSLLVSSQDGHLYCVGRSDGNVRWRSTAGGRAGARPLVIGGLVYIAGSDSCLSAVDIETGKIAWKYPLGETVEFTSPMAHGHDVLVAGRRGTVFCINARSGRARWRTKAARCIRGDLAVDDRLVCVADSSGIAALNPEDGSVLWSRPLPGNSPAVAAGCVYYHAKNGELFILNSRDGETLASIAAGPPGFFGAPLVVGNRVIVAGYGFIQCFTSK